MLTIVVTIMVVPFNTIDPMSTKKHTHTSSWWFDNLKTMRHEKKVNNPTQKKGRWQHIFFQNCNGKLKNIMNLLCNWSIIWYLNCLVYHLAKFSSFLPMQFEELHTLLNSWLIAYYCHHCNTNFSFKDFILADQNYLKSIQHVNWLSSKQVYS
jgi:hypothetical protein